MKKNPSHFAIAVSDMEKSLEFYKKLGCDLLYATDQWSELSFADSSLNLALRHEKNEKGPYGGAGIGFHVEDCEETTIELKKKGFKIRLHCQKMKDKSLLTQIEDPDGNIIWFAQKPID